MSAHDVGLVCGYAVGGIVVCELMMFLLLWVFGVIQDVFNGG